MEGKEKMLEGLFKQMGADEMQAQRMASQLLKRAHQLAEEESMSETKALEVLLKKIIYGQK